MKYEQGALSGNKAALPAHEEEREQQAVQAKARRA